MASNPISDEKARCITSIMHCINLARYRHGNSRLKGNSLLYDSMKKLNVMELRLLENAIAGMF